MKLLGNEISWQDMYVSVSLSLAVILSLETSVGLFLSGYVIIAVVISIVTMFLFVIDIVILYNILCMSESDKEVKE